MCGRKNKKGSLVPKNKRKKEKRALLCVEGSTLRMCWPSRDGCEIYVACPHFELTSPEVFVGSGTCSHITMSDCQIVCVCVCVCVCACLCVCRREAGHAKPEVSLQYV